MRALSPYLVTVAAGEAGVLLCAGDWTLGAGLAVALGDGAAGLLPTAGSPLLLASLLLLLGMAADGGRRAALPESEERWRRLVEQNPEAIHITVGGHFQYLNSAAVDLFGASSPDDLVGRSVLEFVHPDAHAAAQDRLATLQQREPVAPFEHRLVRDDGTERIVVARSVPVTYRGEAAVQTVLRDVTTQRRTQRELQDSQRRYQLLAEYTTDLVMLHDASGAIIWVTPSVEEIFGLPPAVALDTDPFPHVHPDDRDALQQFHARMLSGAVTGPVGPLRYRARHRDGTYVWVESVARPVYDDDRSLRHIVSSTRDVTAHEKAEAQLRRAQKMETVGTLAGGIAHDFNNILHAALVYTQMAAEDLPSSHPAQTFLSRIEQGLVRAEDLVAKLLTFSRPESAITTQLVLAPLVRETLDLAAPALPDPVDVRTRLDEACVVRGDPGQLKQVVMNLVTNAGQAMAEKATADDDAPRVLDVRTQTAHVDAMLAQQHAALAPGRYVCLSVSDTGPGMDADTKARIFEPFFTTKDVGEGTGLGLSVVHGIVQAHDGAVTVHSAPGKGTTFNVYLPLADTSSADVSSAETSASESSPDAPELAPRPDDTTSRILVVDDDETVVELESIRLQRFGYAVTACHSVQAALDAVADAPDAFDLVLTDYAMPGMNGLELVRELRERGVEVPIVLMSGFSAQVSETDVHQAGVSTFLRKPVDSHVLRATLKELLS